MSDVRVLNHRGKRENTKRTVLLSKQMDAHFKIRSVSDGSAWGWGPARINK